MSEHKIKSITFRFQLNGRVGVTSVPEQLVRIATAPKVFKLTTDDGKPSNWWAAAAQAELTSLLDLAGIDSEVADEYICGVLAGSEFELDSPVGKIELKVEQLETSS